MIEEFKKFAMRGNVVDMAMGIVIGVAFGAIVKSLVDDIIMPPVGLALGGVDFSNIFLTLRGPAEPTVEAAKEAGAVTMNIGLFVNAVISFLIVAFALFLLIRAMNRLITKEEVKQADPPAPPRSEVLLEEIRDLLAKK